MLLSSPYFGAFKIYFWVVKNFPFCAKYTAPERTAIRVETHKNTVVIKLAAVQSVP